MNLFIRRLYLISFSIRSQFHIAGLALLTSITKKSSNHCPASGAGTLLSAERHFGSYLPEVSVVPSDSPGVLIQVTASSLGAPRELVSAPGLIPRPELLMLHQLAQSFLSLVTPC